MRVKVICVLAVCLFLNASYAWAGWTTINRDGFVATQLSGISGDNIVGWTEDIGRNPHGFLYNGGNWTDIVGPGESLVKPLDIDGNDVVGWYWDNSGGKYKGFLYNIVGQSYITLEKPGAFDTVLWGKDGNNMVGSYDNENEWVFCGFLYNSDSQVWTSIDARNAEEPWITGTYLTGVSGNNAVGYLNQNGSTGFIYSISDNSLTVLNKPMEISEEFPDGDPETAITTMWPTGIDGNNVVGYCIIGSDQSNTHGFLYNIVDQSWTIYEKPGPGTSNLYPLDIEGDTIVGYSTASPAQGFIYTIPEPGTLVLLVLAGLMLIGKMLIKRKRI